MKQKDIFATLILIMLVGFFVCPLLLPGRGALSLFPKNTLRDGNYLDLAMIRRSVFEDGRLPLWAPGYEGGIPVFAHPAETSLNPVSTVLIGLFHDEVLVDNMTWAVFYLLAACSMYYLCRYVLCFNILGALLSSVVFSMNGLFPYLQENGFSEARSILLLPLLAAFFLKTKDNRSFIVYSGMILAFIALEASLFVPVIALFLFFGALSDSFRYRDHGIRLETGAFRALFSVLVLAFLLACIKLLPVFLTFGTQVRPPGVIYSSYISNPNTFELLFVRLLCPIKAFPTLFVGVVPVVLCVLASFVYFRKMKAYVIGLVLAVWFSFGPNAVPDLNKMLWYLPFFHEMKEIPKYYGLFIVFFISVLSGSFLVFLDKFRWRVVTRLLGSFIIAVVFANLAWSNMSYFNSFNTDLGDIDKAHNRDFFNMEILNGHPGDESIATPLSYFLYKENIGLINQHTKFQDLTPVSPRFFLLPGYAFLAPYTSFLVLPNPFYKGEAYLLAPGSRISAVQFSSNRLVLDIDTQGPDRLVLNQNYDSGWSVSQGIVEKYDGLLSVRLDKAVHCRIRMSYLPVSFVLGLIISLLALAGSIIYLIRVNARCRS